jgi:uncharacterized protein (DUF302 family)
MKYIVTSEKTVDQAAQDFAEAVAHHSFGVLHTYNLKETLNNKGIPFENELRIFEICNPMRASEVLAADMEMNMALPCRVSVYEQDGKTHIGMISPKAMLSMLSDAEGLDDVAESVEDSIRAMIDEAK